MPLRVALKGTALLVGGSKSSKSSRLSTGGCLVSGSGWRHWRPAIGPATPRCCGDAAEVIDLRVAAGYCPSRPRYVLLCGEDTPGGGGDLVLALRSVSLTREVHLMQYV